MLVRYILSSVWIRLSTFSQLSIIQSVVLCVFSLTNFPCDDWENVYTLSYYHHQIASMNHYPLLRVRSRNNGIRCMSLYFYLTIASVITWHLTITSVMTWHLTIAWLITLHLTIAWMITWHLIITSAITWHLTITNTHGWSNVHFIDRFLMILHKTK